jgi:hypothetical protein
MIHFFQPFAISCIPIILYDTVYNYQSNVRVLFVNKFVKQFIDIGNINKMDRDINQFVDIEEGYYDFMNENK